MPLRKLRPSKHLTSFLPFGLDPKVAEIYGVTDNTTNRQRPAVDPLKIIVPDSPGKNESFSPFGGSMRGKPNLPTVHEVGASPPPTAPLPRTETAVETVKGRKRAETVKSTRTSSKDKRETMKLPMMPPPSIGSRLEDWEWDNLECGGPREKGQNLAPPSISLRSSANSLTCIHSTGSSRNVHSVPGHGCPAPLPHRSYTSPASHLARPSVAHEDTRTSRTSPPSPVDPVVALEEMSGDILREAFPAEMRKFDLGGRQRRPSEPHLSRAFHSAPPSEVDESVASHTSTVISHIQSPSVSGSTHSMRSWRESRKARKAIARGSGSEQGGYRSAPPPPRGPLPMPPMRSTSLARTRNEELGEVVVIDSAPEGPLPVPEQHTTHSLERSDVPRSIVGAPRIPPRSELREVVFRQGGSVHSAPSVRSEDPARGIRVPLVLSPMSRSVLAHSVGSETSSHTPIQHRPLPPTPRAPLYRVPTQPLPNALPPPAIPKALTSLQPKIASRLRLKRPSTAPHAPMSPEDASPHRKTGLTRLLPLTSVKSKNSVPPPIYESPQGTPDDYIYSPIERDRPPTRLSAREELPAHPRSMRVKSTEEGFDRARGGGMTALSFLTLDDPYTSHSRSTSAATPKDHVVRSESPITGHIMPPQELSKIGPSHLRNSSLESNGDLSSSPPHDRQSYDSSRPRQSTVWSHATMRSRPYTGTALSPPPRPRGSIPTCPSLSSVSQVISTAPSHGLGISPTAPTSPWRFGADARSAPPTRTSFFDHSDSSTGAPSPDILKRYIAPSPLPFPASDGSAQMRVSAPTPSPVPSDFTLHLASATIMKSTSTPTPPDSSDSEDLHARLSSAEATPRGPRSRSRTEHYVYPPVYNRTSDATYGAPHAMAQGMKSSESLFIDTSLPHIRDQISRRSIPAPGTGPFARYAAATPLPTSPRGYGMPRKASASTTATTSLRTGADDAASIWSGEGMAERAKERKAMNDWLAKPVSRRSGKGSDGTVASLARGNSGVGFNASAVSLLST